MTPEQGEMPTNPAGEMPTEPTAEVKPTVTVEVLQAELMATQKALKEANREAATRRKALDALEAEKQAAEDAKLTEAQKLQKQLADTTAELQRIKLDNMKRDIAAKTGLPMELAARLTGETEEELTADAQALLKVIPKPALPRVGATNPSEGQAGVETDVQKRARIYGRGMGAQIFDPGEAARRGGGVQFVDKEKSN